MPGKMQFTGEKDPSYGAKAATITGLVASVVISASLMFGSPANRGMEGDVVRKVILLMFSAVYTARMAITLFVFLKRRITWWEGIIGAVLLPFLLFSYAWVGGRNQGGINAVDIVGIGLYVSGSYLGTRSELSRHIWKLKPAHHRRLYTQGLFEYSRHINYFGDLVLFTGFGLLTHTAWAFVVPLAMAANFVWLVIPSHDAYLEERYGEEFKGYAGRTKRLIPFVY